MGLNINMKKVFTSEYFQKLILFMFIVLSSLFLREAKIAETGMTDYCYVPPFAGNIVKPNVLMVMDFSGSMQFPTYVPCNFDTYTGQKVALCGTSSSTYNTNTTYSGYFDPNKCYSYSSNSFQEAICDCSNKIGTSSCISGNLLNWISTTRIDIARKVLTGGRTSQSGGNTFLDSEGATYTIRDNNLKCQFTISATQTDNRQLTISNYNDTCPLGNNAVSNARLRIRPSDPSSIKGIIHNFCDISDLNGQINEKCQIIMEFMVFASDGRYGEIRVGKSATIANLINAINNELPYLGTPTGEALWEAYDYYKQRNDHNYEANSADINRGNGNQDPYYDGSGANSKPVPCRKGFILLISDGAWNGNVDPVVPARIMATTDLRDDLPGTQNVITYAVYAFGDLDPSTALQGRQAMITTAIFGGFEDKDGNTWPYPFTQYPNNSRSVSYPLSQCNPNGTWNEPCSEWDTLFNSPKDGLPYNFYEADKEESLRSALISALTDILKRATSGGTVATLTAGKRGFAIFIVQPGFYPQLPGGDASWIGFLRAFWLDFKNKFREDTVEKKWFNLGGGSIDKIFEVVAKEGEAPRAWIVENETTCYAPQWKPFPLIEPVFDAGCELAKTQASQRRVYIFDNNNLIDIDTPSTKNILRSIWSEVAQNQQLGFQVDDTFTNCAVQYLKGETNSTCINNPTYGNYFIRNLTFNIQDLCPGDNIQTRWKLGDLGTSTPSLVGNTPSNSYDLIYLDRTYREYISNGTYRKRTNYLITGANDGMLHAFRVGYFKNTGNPDKPLRLIDAFNSESDLNIGKEEWAFIPTNAIPYLIWYGHKDYCRIPIIDYRTIVVDASIEGGATQNKSSNSWRTLLVGVMGFGGKQLRSYSSSIFVLDLTDWLNGDNNRPRLLWEKTLSDNTLTLSFPVVIRRGAKNQNGEWYVVIGSGPKDPRGETFVANPKIYAFNLNDGTLVQTLTVPDAQNMAVGDLWVVDVDRDYQDDIIYFGTYSLNSGHLYRLNLSDYSISKAFSIGAPILGATITAKDKNNVFWVYFGTGRFLRTEDRDFNYINYLVGFKDACIWGNCTTTYTLNNLENRSNYDYSNRIPTRTESICQCSWDGCGLKDVVVDALYNGTAPSEPPVGWYHMLTNNATYKEMIYSQPLVFGENIDALVFRTSADICKIGGETYLMALCYNTGALCPKPSVITEAGNLNIVKLYLAPGAPPFGQPFAVTSGGRDGKKYSKIVLVGAQSITLPQQIQSGAESRFILWIEK